MSALRRLVQRLRAHAGASAALGTGVAVLVALTVAIPLYSAASAAGILEELADEPPDGRPTFSWFFATDSDIEPLALAELDGVSAYLLDDGARSLGLRVELADRRLVTRRFDVIGATREPTPARLSAVGAFGELAEAVEGRLPEPSDGGTIEVALSAARAEQDGVDVGDELVLVDPELPIDDPARAVPALVVGVWAPIDDEDERWVVRPGNLDGDLVVDVESLAAVLEQGRPPIIEVAQWFVLGDPTGITVARVEELADRQTAVDRRARSLQESVSLRRSPGPVLTEFEQRRADLTDILTGQALPAAAVVGLFVLVVMSRSSARRAPELAVLRSRGAPAVWSLGRLAAEVAVVTLATIPVGIALGVALAWAMGRTDAFLELSLDGDGPPVWQPGELPLAAIGLIAVGVIVVHTAFLVGPARRTVIEHRTRHRARRVLRGVVEQLDLVVVAAAVPVAIAAQRRAGDADGLEDRWLLVAPTAAGLAVGLLAARILPVLVRGAATVAGRSRGTAGFLALQRLHRQGRSATLGVVVVGVASTVTAYVAALSTTAEHALVDDAYQRVGADVAVVEISPLGLPVTPLSELAALPGVDEATRIHETAGRFGDSVAIPRPIEIVAVEPDGFAAIAHWRADNDDQELEELLDLLRTNVDDVIVSRSLVERFDVRVGDRVRFQVPIGSSPGGERTFLATSGTIAAVTDGFTRWDAEADDPLLVMHVEALATQVEAVPFATSLLVTGPDEPDLNGVGTFASSARERVDMAQAAPARRGVFGLLGATFLVSAVVALAAVGLQVVFSVRERAIDAGVLRAIGTPGRTVSTFTSLDVVVLVVGAVVVGSAAGVVVARWAIPEIDVLGTGASAAVAVRIDVPTTVAVVVGFVLAAVLLAVAVAIAVRRLRIAEALRLGETV